MSSWLIDHFAIARWLRVRGIWAYEEPQDGPFGPGDEHGTVDEPNAEDDLGIAHRYDEFDDNHSSVDYRMDESLPYLYETLVT
ncbi:MAG TPA: hypothetical protein EYN66_09545 [Myxococcales bacterium]|nr:hypothetical protein [Myxococcales bacterium]